MSPLISNESLKAQGYYSIFIMCSKMMIDDHILDFNELITACQLQLQTKLGLCEQTTQTGFIKKTKNKQTTTASREKRKETINVTAQWKGTICWVSDTLVFG